jgi:ribosome-associated toxin RatA of RatAB toxin-antitoxin module
MTDRVSSSIRIDAEPSAVMGVIADFPAYPEWADFVKTAEVVQADGEGRPLEVRFVLDAGVIKDDYVLAYDWHSDRRVSWHLVSGKVQRTQDGSYELADSPGGGTDVTYELAVDLNIPMIGMFKRKAEKVITDTALKGLKKRVESR